MITLARLLAALVIVLVWTCLLGPATRDEFWAYAEDLMDVS